MMLTKRRHLPTLLALFLLLPAATMLGAGATADEKPAQANRTLKVFIMTGQSNMQGHSSRSTLWHLKTDPKTAHFYDDILDDAGKPRKIDRVWISDLNEGPRKKGAIAHSTIKQGKLTFGYGANGANMGPELSFGIAMAKLYDGPILIIKCAWGGTSLHTDWRPPSAGPIRVAEFSGGLGNKLASKKIDPKDWETKANAKAGRFYRETVEHVNKVLSDPGQVCPEYDPKAGYEIAGFVWFQGWNDAVDKGAYSRSRPDGYDHYTELLCDFIRDMRRDVKAPQMPFVIGVMGQDGMVTEEDKTRRPHVVAFRNAQAAPADMPEFKGNVFAIRTGQFYDPELKRLDWKWGKVKGYRNKLKREGKSKEEMAAAEKAFIAANWTAEELETRKACSAFSFHYLGSAKFFCQVGEAFAQALVHQSSE